MLQSGQDLNTKYKVDKLIGSGSFGNVYRGIDETLKRLVAIKELLLSEHPPLGSADIPYDEQFKREARLQARFNHPNVVHVYDLFTVGPSMYLIIEYVDGPTLRTWIEEHPSPSLQDTLPIFKDVLTGLQVVHNDPRDIVHRDLKPDNILLTSQGVAKLADFGLAQEGTASLRPTYASQMLPCHPGTPLYRSPEHCPPHGYATSHLYPVSDIYSVGCIFFEMLTAIPYRRAMSQGQRLVGLRPDLPSAVCSFFEQMVTEDSAERFQTADLALAALLDLPSAGLPLSTSPTQAPVETSVLAEALHINLRRQDRDRWALAIQNQHTATARQIHLYLRPPEWIAISPIELNFGGLVSGSESPAQTVYIRPRPQVAASSTRKCEILLDVIYRLEGQSGRRRLSATLPLPSGFCVAE